MAWRIRGSPVVVTWLLPHTRNVVILQPLIHNKIFRATEPLEHFCH